MIVTRQPRIPFSWLLMTMVPWVFFYFLITVGGVNFFILNRLIENPAALTFIISLPGLLFMFIPLGPYISYTSDRIWTRVGRRKAFLLVGFGGMSLVLLAYPLAPSIWVFLGLMFLAAFFGCFNTPFEALKLEIIPPAMRGRSAAIGTWISTSVNILFYMMVLGRFDEVISFMSFSLSGEKVIYWSASAGLLIALFIYIFGIHELPPHSAITGEKFSFKSMWQSLTAPQLRYLYVFGIATGLLGANLGALGSLLYINQWGYSFQEMGFNIAVGGVINLFLIPAVGFLVDKGKGKNRMKIWITCLILVLLLNVSYFSYVTWYLPDQRPSLVEIIFFGEITCVIGIVAGVVYYPLVYDYVPRNLMGTYFAGTAILSGISGFITVNGLGLFLLHWANLFQPPAGEMARVCFSQEMSRAEVAGILSPAGMASPDGTVVLPGDIVVNPWYATGIVQESGLCHEIRLRDPVGDKKRVRLDDLKKEIDGLEAKRNPANAQKLALMQGEYSRLNADVAQRAELWSGEVVNALKDKLIKPGEETLHLSKGRAVTALLPTLRKTRERVLDKLKKSLRSEDPAFVGLRIAHSGHGFCLAVSQILPEGADQEAIINAASARVVSLAQSLAPGLISPTAIRGEALVRPTVSVKITLVENPLPTFVSPISRIVTGVLAFFTEPPPPDQKLITLSRNLGAGDDACVYRVDALRERHGLHVTKVFAQDTPDALESLAPGLVEKLRAEAASLKMTIPVPVVDKGVVPIKYNYLAGYIYIFVMVLCGFLLVGFFLIKEKAGVVRKLGAEEVEAEVALAEERKSKDKEIEAADGTVPNEMKPAEYYVPGHLVPKIVFAIIGLLTMLVAIQQVWPQLRLMAMGEPTEAVVTAVCAKNPGAADHNMTKQAELDAKMKAVADAKDFNWTFYSEYFFETKQGQKITFRHKVGRKLKPLAQLIDDSGLPATARLLYDPNDPDCVVLPMEYSSWFIPTLVGLLGFIAFLVGSTLAWFARKPIPLGVV